MTRQEDAPWWASGADGLGDEDPLSAHRDARRATGDRADDSRREGAPPEDDAHDGTAAPPAWWEEATLALGALARAAGHVRPVQRDGGVGSDQHHEHAATDELCEVCPVCAGLRALERSRPELVEHLTEALRHLTLAARSLVDAHGDERSRRTDDGGLERIDLDGE